MKEKCIQLVMEFTNELRLTFVDDALEILERYFERCAEVAVSNSEPHDYTVSISSTQYNAELTKDNIFVQPQKNLAFQH